MGPAANPERVVGEYLHLVKIFSSLLLTEKICGG